MVPPASMTRCPQPPVSAHPGPRVRACTTPPVPPPTGWSSRASGPLMLAGRAARPDPLANYEYLLKRYLYQCVIGMTALPRRLRLFQDYERDSGRLPP